MSRRANHVFVARPEVFARQTDSTGFRIRGSGRVGWAKRSVPTIQDNELNRWWARRKRAFAHPTPAPDGQISLRDRNLSIPFAKNISLSPSGKSVVAPKTCPALAKKIFRFRRRANQFYQLAPSRPARGAYRDRHERGMGCGGRGSVGAQVCSQGGFRERATARRTNGAGCVRQNRVVSTPVAGAKSSGGEVNSTELDQP